MELLLIIFAIIWGTLQIVLFFKIWGMCNDVAKLTDKFAPTPSKTPETKEEIDAWLNNN